MTNLNSKCSEVTITNNSPVNDISFGMALRPNAKKIQLRDRKYSSAHQNDTPTTFMQAYCLDTFLPSSVLLQLAALSFLESGLEFFMDFARVWSFSPKQSLIF